jgi:hypothetical protein
VVLHLDEEAFKGGHTDLELPKPHSVSPTSAAGQLLGSIRYSIYAFMENPSKNIFAKIYAFVSLLFVAVSVVGMFTGRL